MEFGIGTLLMHKKKARHVWVMHLDLYVCMFKSARYKFENYRGRF